MNDYKKYTQSGLPIPNYQEGIELEQFINIGTPDYPYQYEYLSEKIKTLSPAIGEIIRHDISYFLEYELQDSYTEDESIKYTNGIEIGYDFAIAVVTYLQFLRSNDDSLENYLNSITKNPGQLPVQSDAEKSRIKRLRTDDHSILIEQNQKLFNKTHGVVNTEEVIRGYDLAEKDCGDYLFESAKIGNLLSIVIIENTQNFYFNKDSEIEVFQNGIHHGFDNAIEMYIQSREEAILQSLEF
jgi:hypothetical protein